MNESILTSIKKLLNISEDDTSFDLDIILHINSVFATMNQLGLGPVDGFDISDKTAVWSDVLSTNKLLAFVKSYVYLKVKLLFDPPTSSAVMDSINRQIAESEWRIANAIETSS